MKKDELQEIKDALEDATRNPEIKINGEQAVLKSPEQKEAELQFDSWKAEKHEVSEIKEFALPNELIQVILRADNYSGLVLHGEGGIGKTIMSLSVVKQHLAPDEWDYSNGYTTPLALYEFLYNNRNRKVIILDDVEGVFNNNLSLSILKGALWDSDGKRIVQYSSKSDKATMPSKFMMKAKIIILCNHVPKENDISTRAMLSRTISYEMRFSFEEKIRICEAFVVTNDKLTTEQKADVLKLLKSNVSEATKDFNFRTLQKLIAFVKYDKSKAEKLFRATTEIDEDKEAFMVAVKSTPVVKTQIQVFSERTGKSRRTFFNVKRKFGAMVQSKKDTAPAPL